MKHRWLNAMLYGALSLASSVPIAADEKPDLSVATDSANVADPRAPSGLCRTSFPVCDPLQRHIHSIRCR